MRLLLPVLLCCSLCGCSDDSTVPPVPERVTVDLAAADRQFGDRPRADAALPADGRRQEAAVAPDKKPQADGGPKLVLKGPCDPKCPPVCDAIGSKSEGFYTCNHVLIGWTLCSKCSAPTCQLVGTAAEGWYTSCPG